MDKKSLIDMLGVKKDELATLVAENENLVAKLNDVTDIAKATLIDNDLTENSNKISEYKVEISDLENKIEGLVENMGNKKKSYLDTRNALADWNTIQNTASNKLDAKALWEAKLVENGVTVDGETAFLPSAIDLGIQSTQEANPIYGLFSKAPGGRLVCKKFNTKDKAITRGTEFNITEAKTEQESTLTVKTLPQNQIYKLTSVDYATLKAIGSEITPFITNELTQFVIDAMVDLALYDGEGVDDSNKKGGFDSVVKSDASIQVEYNGTLSNAIRNNAFRARGASTVTIAGGGNAGAGNGSVLIVNSKDYGEIQEAATALNYNISDMPGWLGVGSIVIRDTASANYKPIVMRKGAYIIAHDAFDKFDWYNIMNNTNKSEVVTLANGTLFDMNATVVFTKAETADKADEATK